MNITCPQCGFSRQLHEDKLPAPSVVATCPKCACRFRFGVRDESTEIISTPRAEQPVEPVPPGAVIPGEAEAGPAAPAAGEQARPQGKADGRSSAARASEQAAAQMDQALHEQEDAAYAAAEPNPWQLAPGREGWLAALYQTIMRVLFAAPRFFAGIRPEDSQMRAVAFCLIIGLVETLSQIFWMDVAASWISGHVAEGGGQDPLVSTLLQGMASDGNVPMTVLASAASQVVQLYLSSGMVYLAYRLICPDRADFSLVFLVMAFSTAPGIFCVVPLLGWGASLIWGIACTLVGCRVALRLSWPQTVMGFAPLLLFKLFMMMQIVRVLQSL